MPKVGAAMNRDAGGRGGPPAGRQQQLPTGRAVEAGELNIGKREIRRQPQHQTVRTRVGQGFATRSLGAQSGPAGSG